MYICIIHRTIRSGSKLVSLSLSSTKNYSLWKMCDDESPFLRQHLLLFGSEAVHQLLSHRQEDGTEEHASENERGVVFLKTLAEYRYVTETHPPGGTRNVCVSVNGVSVCV